MACGTDLLSYHTQSTEQKCISVICYDGIDSTCAIEIGKFGFGFSRCLDMHELDTSANGRRNDIPYTN